MNQEREELHSLKGIICFAAVDWRFLKQRPHHLMSACAGAGLKVLFIENTGVRTPHLGDAVRIEKRLKNAIMRQKRNIEELDNLEVYAPLAIPFPFNKAARWYNGAYLKDVISRFLSRHSLSTREVLLWTYLTTPLVLDIAGYMDWYGVVYDVVGDPKEIEPRLAPYEQKLLRLADHTLFASATLKQQYHDQTRNPILFRDGFNIELETVACKTPPAMAGLPRPKLLYIGGINRKFWVEVIEVLSKSLPGASIVLLGPVAPDGVNLPAATNISHLPTCRNYEDLAGYLRSADAALIPYRLDRYAGAMHPAKLNEYIVFGLPIVATATPELRRLAAEWPEKTLYLAKTPEEFVRVTVQAIAEDSPDLRARRQSIARDRTWQARVDDLLGFMT